MPTPPIATRLNHVAYPTADTAGTVRFYTEVMGFTLAHAIRGETDPETRDALPHLHTFFSMGSGEVIAFFDIAGLTPSAQDSMPRWVRHLALSVDSRETLAAWQAHLARHGIHVTGPVDHEGVWLSIYFADPNGVMLELTHQSRALTAADAADAATMVAAWTGRSDVPRGA
jgi:catechol 2,3-dioxygenase-like lactoylglutathione lyase family enzyme